MSKDIILTDLTDGVFTVTLNRPKVNALNQEVSDLLKDAFSRAEIDEDIRSIILTASGKFFSAGQDVKVIEAEEQISFREHLDRSYHPLIIQMRQLEKPILPAVNGAVAGAALGIVLACDLRIASDTARFIVAFGGIGLAPDSAVSLLLPSLIGLGRAAEAAYFNKPISVEQALAWGLVNKVVPFDELQDEARSWAAKLADGPIGAMGLTKRDFNKAMLPNLKELLGFEADMQEIAGNAPEHKEGLAAFLEGRDPDYRKVKGENS